MTIGRRRPDRPPPSGSARVAALRLLGRRDYTAAEIEARLLDRGYSAPDVAETLAALRNDRTLDDQRVAANHVRTASQVKGRGRLRIRRELESRGLSRTIVDSATASLSQEDEQLAIERFVRRRTGGRPLDDAGRRRLYGQLIRRGFPAELVVHVLGKAGSSDPA